MKIIFRIIFWCIMAIWGYYILDLWQARREVNMGGFLFALISAAYVLAEAIGIMRRMGLLSSSWRKDLLVLLGALFVSLMMTELVLRSYAVSLQGHNEAGGDHNYHSAFQIFLNPCDSCGGRELYVNQSGAEVDIRNAEFSYRHVYNGYGLRDRPFRRDKDSNEYRIIGVGDSFTEGVGTSADSTWLRQLEGRLARTSNGRKYTTMNAGAHGSDLYFGYDLLSRCLLRYRPDLVILDLNSTDIGDVSRAGGDERFDSEGHFRRMSGPWWEFGFGSSYIVRLVALRLFKYDWQLRSPAMQRQDDEISLARISKKINDFQTLARKAHFEFLLVLQPLPSDLTRSDPYAGLHLDSAVRVLNLYPHFKEKIVARGEPLEKYYWSVDGHYKGYGYGEMAQQIYAYYFR